MSNPFTSLKWLSGIRIIQSSFFPHDRVMEDGTIKVIHSWVHKDTMYCSKEYYDKLKEYCDDKRTNQ